MLVDEFCFVCGITKRGPPSHLLGEKDLVDATAEEIVSDIGEDPDGELLCIVKEALLASFTDSGYPEWWSDWLPKNIDDFREWPGSYYMVIGYFDTANGRGPMRGRKVPDGRNVQLRCVTELDGDEFRTVVCTSGWITGLDDEDIQTPCSTHTVGSPNVVVCLRCFYYLKHWLGRADLPPPAISRPSTDSGSTLSFAGEFYELINSRKWSVLRGLFPILPDLHYDGFERVLEYGEGVQEDLMPNRQGVKHTEKAIKDGLRGHDLLPAIVTDCRAWMFAYPDTWPEPPESPIPIFSTLNLRYEKLTAFHVLPNELMFVILCILPLQDLLALSATCRSLRAMTVEPSMMNSILKHKILDGDLYWVLPVKQLPYEERRAFDLIKGWLPEHVRPEKLKDVGSVKALCKHQDFPHVQFIRACWASDSMWNRRRLWGMAEQFEDMWIDFRLYGREVDRFFPSSEILNQLQVDPTKLMPVNADWDVI